MNPIEALRAIAQLGEQAQSPAYNYGPVQKDYNARMRNLALDALRQVNAAGHTAGSRPAITPDPIRAQLVEALSAAAMQLDAWHPTVNRDAKRAGLANHPEWEDALAKANVALRAAGEGA